MLAPFLLVGVGGSGGKTLRTAKAALERRLRELGWEQELPSAWQFLHIDVPSVADGLDPELPGALPSRDYAGLVGSGVTYKTVDKILSANLPPDVNLRATGGWRPVAEQVAVPIDKGAGQFRAIGRVITVTHLDKVKDAIEDSVGSLRGPEVKGELQQVARLIGADETQEMPEPIVVIVSSIAGGSGAGAVVDVCWTVRAAGIDPDQTFSVLYAPDVFDGIPSHLRKGVRPNALATLSELCAAWWNDEGIEASTQSLYSQRGVTIPSSGDTIPRMILVGRRNQSVDYVEQNNVYVAMGRSLAAWISSETVQDEFSAYFVTNAAAASLSTDRAFPSQRSYQTPPFRGIGFARVALGRDLFGEYAQQWLAREGVDIVLRAHERTRRGPEDDRTPRELVAEKGSLDFRGFLIEAGLDERGPENNQIVDALEPADRLHIYENLVTSIKQNIRNAFGADGLDGGQVADRIATAAMQLRRGYLDEERAGQLERGQAWVGDIQKRISRAVAKSVARSGAMVTSYMLDQTIRDEVPFVVEELKREGMEHEHYSSDAELRSRVQSKLGIVSGGNFRMEDPAVDLAIKEAANCTLAAARASQWGLAWELLEDLAENFLEPMNTAVEHGRQRLYAEEEPQGARPSYISLWPKGDQIPKSLKPSSNEFLLEDTDTFYPTLQRLLASSVPKAGQGDPVGGAVASVLVGADVFIDENEQKMIESRTTWVPKNHELRVGSEPPRRAKLDAALAGEAILSRARLWSFDRDRKIGQYMHESLGGYLSEESADPETVRARLLKFEGQIGAAVRASEPLIEVDGEMLQMVHGLSKPSVTYLLSELPFREGSDGEAARTIVERLKSQTEGEMKYSYEDSDAQFIDVFALMDVTLQPVVIESLMGPIAEDWAAAKMSAASREQFWRWRRARPLPEFIPVSPAIRRAMVRGYFTALLLNWLETPEGPGDGFSIWDPAAEKYVAFPNPLLQPTIRDGSEYAPAILKSIPLAWLDSMVQRNLAPMRPYRILLELGGRGDDSMGADGSSLEQYLINRNLQNYLRDGDEDSTETLEDRQEAMVERLGGWLEGFGELFEDESKNGDPHRVPRAYEMQDDIVAALDDLQEAVRHADLAAESSKKSKFL
jgi:hypothetical protein